MGQARQRGSREDRIAQAQEKLRNEEQTRRIAAAARRQKYLHWFWSLSDEDRAEEVARIERKERRRYDVMSLLGLGWWLGSPGLNRWGAFGR